MFDTANAFQQSNQESSIVKIPGLKYIPDFLSQKEHSDLWLATNKEVWITDIKRRVQHYGWKYDYKLRSIDYSMYLGEFPDWVKSVALRLVQKRYMSKMPDQLIINEYLPGQGIANHVDCEPCFEDTIVSISLGTNCIMDLINLKTKEKIEILLEPKSLVIISGEARYNWTHGIAARRADNINGTKFERKLRISMTFRNVILSTCNTIK